MYKFGLKLWSINKNYVEEAIRLYEQGLYDYIELFAVPNSYQDFVEVWKSLKVPYVIHAAHSAKGLNLAKKEMFPENLILANEAKKFADELNAQTIIFHPGVDGRIEETANQLNKIYDSRIVIENKPYYGIYDNLICNGSLPEEIEFIIKNTNVGFCLDIGHAIYAANAKKIDQVNFIKDFLKLKPKMFHLSDGDWNGVYDLHKHLGTGNFDFLKIFSILPDHVIISIETEKSFKDSLRDFEEDIIFLRKTINKNEKNKNCNSYNKTMEY